MLLSTFTQPSTFCLQVAGRTSGPWAGHRTAIHPGVHEALVAGFASKTTGFDMDLVYGQARIIDPPPRSCSVRALGRMTRAATTAGVTINARCPAVGRTTVWHILCLH